MFYWIMIDILTHILIIFATFTWTHVGLDYLYFYMKTCKAELSEMKFVVSNSFLFNNYLNGNMILSLYSR